MMPSSNTAASTISPAHPKPPRWKRAAYTLADYAAAMVVSMSIGLFVCVAMNWIFASL